MFFEAGDTGTLKVIRRAIPDFQDLNSKQLPCLLRPYAEETVDSRAVRDAKRIL
jgi:hypothetical protein